MDWTGLGIFVASVAAAIVSVGTFIRTGRVETKTDVVTTKVDGNYSDLAARLDRALEQIDRMSEAAGVEAHANREERANLTGLAAEQARVPLQDKE